MDPLSLALHAIRRQLPTAKISFTRSLLKSFRTTSAIALLSATSGCGTFLAAISNGPFCPYEGVTVDFTAMTNWDLITHTGGMSIPLGIIDLPFSFIADTFNLSHLDEMSKTQCPRHFD
ncbi:YceK/YidQ family lipoprotein [Pseudomonas sp. GCEP-101]|uniref:YceK/YidQ family lipoprotein n=1 Tax=Pseudomonas sp. GCEP-101 TaxID=2974552 RepID=UPI00223B4D27|nr:YceK/YidQ family lipoprotein [Pseudomonas sp. GCEP-101]